MKPSREEDESGPDTWALTVGSGQRPYLDFKSLILRPCKCPVPRRKLNQVCGARES